MKNQWWKGLSLFAVLSVTMTLDLGIGMGVGYYLTKKYELSPLVVGMFTFVGFGIGIFHAISIVKKVKL
jgi:F0F1-type ATP synthase assembly protein I